VREVLTSENVEEIRSATDSLMSVVQELGAAAYQQGAPEAGQPGESGSEEAGAAEDDGEDVVDGEFKEEEEQE